MCFDVPKVVWSPGCDHGQDEEYRNGRDVKIDILEGYIRTSERFLVIRVFFGVPGSYGNSSGEVLGLIGPYRKGGSRPKGRLGPPMGPNWTRGRGGAPFPFPTPSLFPSFFSPTPERKRGILLGLGSPSRTPHTWRAPARAGLLLLPPLYTWAGDTPKAQ